MTVEWCSKKIKTKYLRRAQNNGSQLKQRQIQKHVVH
jgi:hypothetical protein